MRTGTRSHLRASIAQSLPALIALSTLALGTRAAAAENANQGDTTASSNSTPTQLQEVVVTAELRKESLADVPMSLTAINGQVLTRAHSFRLEDFAASVPGLTLNSYSGLGSQLVIDGISSGTAPVNSGVATYIDETPYTTEGPFANSLISAPDIDSFDMQRIEVLRGPQGTLYGANALSGILKYVTNPPDPKAFAARAESGVSSTLNGAIGFDAHGMVNIPLSSVAALRIVGYDNDYPGFIDDPSRGLRNTNGARYEGGRASLLYEPVSQFSVRLNALYQRRQWSDYAAEDVLPGTLAPEYGNLLHQQLINDQGDVITELFNATVHWDPSFGHLVSATSYYRLRPSAIYDYPQFNGAAGAIYGPEYAGAAVTYQEPVQSLTQELRLSSEDNRPLTWLLGGYFTNESAEEVQRAIPIEVPTRSLAGNLPLLLNDYIPVHYQEYAAFADLDYHFTDSFDASVGGRYSRNHQTFFEAQRGLLGGPDVSAPSSEGVFTYSGDLRWHVTPRNMVYARIASGFAPGGPSGAFPGSPLPPTYGSSSTVDYEIGGKGAFLDGRARATLSAFDINWRDIQFVANVGGYGGVVNGGAAKSRGVEASYDYDPIPGLTLGANAAYTDAYLTQETPASVGGVAGDRLPAVSKWQLSANAKYEAPITGELAGFVAGDGRFLSDRYSDFIGGSPRQVLPSYYIVDLQAGIETDRWSATLYAKNVTNRLAILSVQPETLAGGNGPQEATLYTPRTVGLTLTANIE